MRVVPDGLSIPFSMLSISDLCSLGNVVVVDGDRRVVFVKKE